MNSEPWDRANQNLKSHLSSVTLNAVKFKIKRMKVKGSTFNWLILLPSLAHSAGSYFVPVSFFTSLLTKCVHMCPQYIPFYYTGHPLLPLSITKSMLTIDFSLINWRKRKWVFAFEDGWVVSGHLHCLPSIKCPIQEKLQRIQLHERLCSLQMSTGKEEKPVKLTSHWVWNEKKKRKLTAQIVIPRPNLSNIFNACLLSPFLYSFDSLMTKVTYTKYFLPPFLCLAFLPSSSFKCSMSSFMAKAVHMQCINRPNTKDLKAKHVITCIQPLFSILSVFFPCLHQIVPLMVRKLVTLDGQNGQSRVKERKKYTIHKPKSIVTLAICLASLSWFFFPLTTVYYLLFLSLSLSLSLVVCYFAQ